MSRPCRTVPRDEGRKDAEAASIADVIFMLTRRSRFSAVCQEWPDQAQQQLRTVRLDLELDCNSGKGAKCGRSEFNGEEKTC